MFLDASVLVAIFNDEEDRNELERRIGETNTQFYTSPIVMFEASLAIARSTWVRNKGQGPSRTELIAQARASLEEYLGQVNVVELKITPDIGSSAIEAAATYGKAAGHKAALNMGDCFSYACAKSIKVPLLYKGNDFAQTDLA